MEDKYAEKISIYPSFEYLIFFLIAVLIISPSISSIYLKKLNSSFLYSIITIGLLLYVYSSFRELEIFADSNRLEFGFKIFKRSFPIDKIVNCSETQIKFSNYLGWGIRYGIFDGTIAYNTRLGKGVRIDVLGQKRAYVFNCSDPKGLCDFLRSAREKKQLGG